MISYYTIGMFMFSHIYCLCIYDQVQRARLQLGDVPALKGEVRQA